MEPALRAHRARSDRPNRLTPAVSDSETSSALDVTGVARHDVETLCEWSLEARVGEVTPVLEVDDPVGLAIPDDDADEGAARGRAT